MTCEFVLKYIFLLTYDVINIVYYDIGKLYEISTSNEDVSHVAYHKL